MVTMNNGRMAYLLSMKTHREKFPVIRWIEDNIREGKVSIGGKACKEVIEEVTVRHIEDIVYNVVGGEVTSLELGWVVTPYFEDPARPRKEEIDLLEVCDHNQMQWLRTLCFDLIEAFNRPHSCSIDYYVREERCERCERVGSVNYYDGKNWSYYCGGSDRCCP